MALPADPVSKPRPQRPGIPDVGPASYLTNSTLKTSVLLDGGAVEAVLAGLGV